MTDEPLDDNQTYDSGWVDVPIVPTPVVQAMVGELDPETNYLQAILRVLCADCGLFVRVWTDASGELTAKHDCNEGANDD